MTNFLRFYFCLLIGGVLIADYCIELSSSQCLYKSSDTLYGLMLSLFSGWNGVMEYGGVLSKNE